VLKAISRFERRGIKPTVRQIHYHFTELKPARIPNIKKAYAKLDEYITDARKKGVIEWGRIQEDQRKTEITLYRFYNINCWCIAIKWDSGSN
jgi:hypothetical protein